MRIGIAVDSCCDLPKDFIDEHNIVVMPITLRIGDLLVEDRRDPIETQAFYTKHLDKKSWRTLPSRFLIPSSRSRSCFWRSDLDYDYVFCLITSGRSAIYDHAMVGFTHHPDQVSRCSPRRRGAGAFWPGGIVLARNMFAVVRARAGGRGCPAHPPGRHTERDRSAPAPSGRNDAHLHGAGRSVSHLQARLEERRQEHRLGVIHPGLDARREADPALPSGSDRPKMDKVRGFETGAERLFTKAADRIRRGLEVPHICISYGGPLSDVARLPGYAELEKAASESNVAILLSPMSKTAVNVGPGAVTLAFAAPGQPCTEENENMTKLNLQHWRC